MNKRFLTILYPALALCFIGTEARGDGQSLFDRSEYQLGPMSEGRAHQFQIPLINASASSLSILSEYPPVFTLMR
jgi:hypothetical protein